MSEQSKIEGKLGMPWPFAAPELLDQTQHAIDGWMKRRQEGMELGFRSFQVMCACKNPVTFAAAYGEWLTNSVDLFLAEMNEARAAALRWAAIGQTSLTMPFGQPADAAARGTGSPAPTTRTKGAASTEAVRDRSAAE